MEAIINAKELISSGVIKDELTFQRAKIISRNLRLLSKENENAKETRKALNELLYKYEQVNWEDFDAVTDEQIIESDKAVNQAEIERVFFQNRTELLRQNFKKYQISQQQFGRILGHNNKSYVSEIVNGIKPFSMKDIIVTANLFKINLGKLIYTELSSSEKEKINKRVVKVKAKSLKIA